MYFIISVIFAFKIQTMQRWLVLVLRWGKVNEVITGLGGADVELANFLSVNPSKFFHGSSYFDKSNTVGTLF